MTLVREITNRQLWLSWRKKALTASDIAAVVGVDPYRSPLSVYAEKVGVDVAVEENSQMRRGRFFEPAAVEYLRDAHPTWEIWRPNTFYLDDDIGLGATPDCLARDDEGKLINIQIKTISGFQFRKWEGRAPIGYLLQTACENLLVNADDGILAVLVVTDRDAELQEFPVPRHPGAEKRICDEARRFWANIKAGVAPRPDYQLDGEIIKELHPPDPDVPPLDLSSDNRIYELVGEHETLTSEIRTHNAEVKTLKAKVKTIEGEVIEKLGGAETATANGWNISYSMIHKNAYTVAATDYPSLKVSRAKEGTA